EMIYNLRAALDYVVFEPARFDSGQTQNGTQFPIEDKPEGFKGRQKTYLKGLTDPHVALVEEYQPCQGCNWTATLRDLSNPDKHRELHLLLSQLHDEIEVATGHGFSAEELDLFDNRTPEDKARR